MTRYEREMRRIQERKENFEDLKLALGTFAFGLEVIAILAFLPVLV